MEIDPDIPVNGLPQHDGPSENEAVQATTIIYIPKKLHNPDDLGGVRIMFKDSFPNHIVILRKSGDAIKIPLYKRSKKVKS